jgi:hypothetical protein
MSDNNSDADSTDSTDTNISRLREMAIRGKNYREEMDFEYYGETITLYIKALTDVQFLPIAAFLEDRLDLDPEEAREQIEEERGDDTGGLDPANFDEDFVEIMQEAAVMGIDSEKGDAEGEDEDGLREIVKMLQGGSTLLIAETVLEISSDAESAESFRRDGGGE